MPENDLFENVLNLLKLNNKQDLLSIKMVESLAFEALKRERAPRLPTVVDIERGLTEYIAWNFVPNVDDFGAQSIKLRKINQAKFETLKRHLLAIRDLLENVVMKG